MSMQSDTNECLRQLERHQESLYAYIVSLVGNADDARDLLQEASVFVIQQADEYQAGTNFLAWSCRIAYYKVRTYWRDKKRGRLLFDDSLLDSMSKKSLKHVQLQFDRQEALDVCLEKLPSDKQKILRQRYYDSMSVSEISSHRGKSYESIVAMLYRLRLALMDCIEKAIASGVQR
ncbi:hypothetical protein MNBD_PLANCTO02-3119 [hydrothermal vent metagenome]|uniref:RNA polymerase sigma-70 region 2 domain-containing protein n=1 Tax=hydrothermal vent metagenome TaxID=652676 RepID=A0A3B1DKN5_9ZZZZ